MFIPFLDVNESVPLWFMMELNASEVDYNPEDSFEINIQAEDEWENEYSEQYTVKHCRFNIAPSNIRWEWIRSRTHYVRVKFDHVVDDNFTGGVNAIVYSVYVNSQFVKSFTGNQVDVNVDNIDKRFTIDIIATPCEGFYYIIDEVDGNSVKLQYRSRKYNIDDIDHFNIYYDNKTGTLTDDPIGKQDAITGIATGKKVKTGGIIAVPDITGFTDEFESSSSSSQSSSSDSSSSQSSASSSSTEHSSSSQSSSLSSASSSLEYSSWTSSSQSVELSFDLDGGAVSSSSYGDDIDGGIPSDSESGYDVDGGEASNDASSSSNSSESSSSSSSSSSLNSSSSSSSSPGNPYPDHAFKFTITIPASVIP